MRLENAVQNVTPLPVMALKVHGIHDPNREDYNVIADSRTGDPNHTVVRGNQLWANTPADLLYDGTGTDNRLSANRCQTSIPDGLCG